MIAPTPDLSIRRQCDFFGFCRSSYYYKPVPLDSEDLDLMDRIDREYLEHPFFGSRRMTVVLRAAGLTVNRKRIQRLMRLMGLEAVYPKKNLSISREEDKKYPYLLRGVQIARPNQVWSTDITYVRTGRGHAYLVVIMDWFSRKVLSWRLSSTIDASFCVEALDEALTKYGNPEIFNSDQGSQFTGHDFTWRLEERGILISRDGRGRAFDNIFVERLWRTVKYEDLYLKQYETMEETRAGLDRYFRFYNTERPHSSHGNRTPDKMYNACSDMKEAG